MLDKFNNQITNLQNDFGHFDFVILNLFKISTFVTRILSSP